MAVFASYHYIMEMNFLQYSSGADLLLRSYMFVLSIYLNKSAALALGLRGTE